MAMICEQELVILAKRLKGGVACVGSLQQAPIRDSPKSPGRWERRRCGSERGSATGGWGGDTGWTKRLTSVLQLFAKLRVFPDARLLLLLRVPGGVGCLGSGPGRLHDGGLWGTAQLVLSSGRLHSWARQQRTERRQCSSSSRELAEERRPPRSRAGRRRASKTPLCLAHFSSHINCRWEPPAALPGRSSHRAQDGEKAHSTPLPTSRRGALECAACGSRVLLRPGKGRVLLDLDSNPCQNPVISKRYEEELC